MSRRIAGAVLLLWAMAALPQAGAIINPHGAKGEQMCSSCHTPKIHSPARRQGDPRLLTPSVDGVCLVCHERLNCCRTGRRQRAGQGGMGTTHPSGLLLERVAEEMRPRSLPVSGGRITCNTCHRHDRATPEDYRLLRLVVIRDTGVDWTALCEDCHPGY